jgi:hypothetical protein
MEGGLGASVSPHTQSALRRTLTRMETSMGVQPNRWGASYPTQLKACFGRHNIACPTIATRIMASPLCSLDVSAELYAACRFNSLTQSAVLPLTPHALHVGVGFVAGLPPRTSDAMFAPVTELPNTLSQHAVTLSRMVSCRSCSCGP